MPCILYSSISTSTLSREKQKTCSTGVKAHLGEAESDLNLHHVDLWNVVVPAAVNVPPAWALIQ